MAILSGNEKWLVASGGKDYSFIINGWYPESETFDWDIRNLHNKIKQLRTLKLIFGIRPGVNSGTHTEMLFDQLPIPLVVSYVIKEFSDYIDGFVLVSLQAGIIINNRYKKYTKTNALIPLPNAFFSDPDEVPNNRMMAIIDDHYCVRKEFVNNHQFKLRGVEFVPFLFNLHRPSPQSPDFSSLFIKNTTKINEVEIEKKILQFTEESLSEYKSNNNLKLYGLLFDCDPEYGYIIIALKQTPIIDKYSIDIDDFEIDQLSILQPRDLYGDYKYFTATQLRKIFNNVIHKLSEHALIKSLSSPIGMHLAYSFHDEVIHWIT